MPGFLNVSGFSDADGRNGTYPLIPTKLWVRPCSGSMAVESKLARQAERELVEATQRLTPEERLNAFLTHCELMMEQPAIGCVSRKSRSGREGK